MNTPTVLPRHFRSLSLLGGAVLAGTLDLAFATCFWSLKGVAPTSVLQSIASGLIGNTAYRGGASTAVLGLALHFGIACMMVLAYYLASRRWPLLRRRTLACGLLYGLLLYAIMNGIVVPLSAAHAPPFAPAWFVGNILSHCLLVGVPCALATHWATRIDIQTLSYPEASNAGALAHARRPSATRTAPRSRRLQE